MSGERIVHVYTFSTELVRTSKGFVSKTQVKPMGAFLPDTELKDLIVGKRDTIAPANITDILSALQIYETNRFYFDQYPETDEDALKLKIRKIQKGKPADVLVVSRQLTHICELAPNTTLGEFLGVHSCLVIASEEKFREFMPKATITK